MREMRVTLFAGHLTQDTSLFDDCSALRLFRAVALENRWKAPRGDSAWQGLPFWLDVEEYRAAKHAI